MGKELSGPTDATKAATTIDTEIFDRYELFSGSFLNYYWLYVVTSLDTVAI